MAVASPCVSRLIDQFRGIFVDKARNRDALFSERERERKDAERAKPAFSPETASHGKGNFEGGARHTAIDSHEVAKEDQTRETSILAINPGVVSSMEQRESRISPCPPKSLFLFLSLLTLPQRSK